MATAVPVSVPIVLSPSVGTNATSKKTSTAHMVTSKAASSLGASCSSNDSSNSTESRIRLDSASTAAAAAPAAVAATACRKGKVTNGPPVLHGFSDNYWTNIKSSHNSATSKSSSTSNSNKEQSEVTSKGFKLDATNANTNTNSSSGDTSKTNAKTALDALAILASSAHHQLSSNNHRHQNRDDSQIMPPPPPRIKGRLRSASNPEGMEKWDSYSYFRSNQLSHSSYDASTTMSTFDNDSSQTSSLWSAASGWNGHSSNSYSARRHFVLPSCILEEELAEANETCKIHAEQRQMEQMKHFMDSSQQQPTPQPQAGYNPIVANTYAHANTSSRNAVSQFQPSLKRGMTIFSIEQFVEPPKKNNQPNDHNNDVHMNLDVYGTSPTTVISSIDTTHDESHSSSSSAVSANGTSTSSLALETKKKKKKKKPLTGSGRDGNLQVSFEENKTDKNQSYNSHDNKDKSSVSFDGRGEEENDILAPLEDESDLDPAELLRRARNKLFEDLSCSGNCGMEKGVVPLPHSLDKYKEVYNKNGRIGIYTPAERAAIIAKFNSKRTRRVWNKKIRYNCRKSLADRRMRVKGRFVKRAVEQENAQQKQHKGQKDCLPSKTSDVNLNKIDPSCGGSSSSASSSRTSSPIPSAPPSGPLAPVQEDDRVDGDGDVEMPDVNDPEAGFKPTLNQPYRRTRRHTIT